MGLCWGDAERMAYKRTLMRLGAVMQQEVTRILDAFHVHPDIHHDIAEYLPVERGVRRALRDITKGLLMSEKLEADREEQRLAARRAEELLGEVDNDLEGCRDMGELLDVMARSCG
jgi:hypothetical protein